jgi:hypothetical protein
VDPCLICCIGVRKISTNIALLLCLLLFRRGERGVGELGVEGRGDWGWASMRGGLVR